MLDSVIGGGVRAVERVGLGGIATGRIPGLGAVRGTEHVRAVVGRGAPVVAEHRVAWLSNGDVRE
jgi:hypothetical protein